VPARPSLDPPPAVATPPGSGTHPAIVIGAEAYGPNEFSARVQQRLVELGYATVVPDYYHGGGPTKKEAYDDFTEVMEHIARLDFTAGARDLAETVDMVRARPDVDPARVSVWGYCTGGTLAWLAAGLRGDLAAAVLFFPSQPVFAEHGPTTPVDPMDLLWQLSCPTLFIYGENDMVMPPERREELRSRIDRWGVPAEVRVYAGANHAFTAPFGPLSHPEAASAAWDDAVSFLRAHTGS
jgi:carboxymethylenebutenolidase